MHAIPALIAILSPLLASGLMAVLGPQLGERAARISISALAISAGNQDHHDRRQPVYQQGEAKRIGHPGQRQHHRLRGSWRGKAERLPLAISVMPFVSRSSVSRGMP